MAGSPGGTEEGRASIRVVPDTSRFAVDLRAQLEKLRSEIALNIPVELDTTGLAEKAKAAVAEANKAAGNVHVKVDVDKPTLTRAASTLRKFSSDIGSSIASTLKFASFAGLGLSALNAVPGVLSLAGSLTSVVGVIGLIPAGIAGAVAGIGTLVLGFNGFGDALKNIGDPAKFAAAIKELAPSAQAAALAIRGLTPQFHALQQSVQGSLFSNLDQDIKMTARVLLPVLGTELTLIASGFNEIFHQAAAAFQVIAINGTLQTTLHNIGRAVVLLSPAFGSLIEAFSRVASVGSSFLPGFAESITSASAAFAKFVDQTAKSGALHDFIQGALTAFGQLFDVVKSTASILGGLVKAAQAAGGGTLATLATLLQNVANVVNSPAFQTGLTSVFAGIQAGASALAGALPAIGAALEALAPAIAAFATNLGPVLAAAIQAIVPVIIALAPALTQLITVLGSGLVTAINAVAPVIQQLATALAANQPLLIAVAAALAAIFAPALLVAGVIAVVVLNFQTLANFFTNNILPVLVTVQTFLQPVIDAFTSLGTTIVASVTALLPIVQQLAAVFVTQWPAIQSTVVSVFTAVRDIVVSVISIITSVIKLGVILITELWGVFGGTILATVNRVFPAILQIVRGAFDILAGIFQAVAALLRGDWSGLWSALGRIVKGAIDVIVGLVRGIGGLLLGAIGEIKDAALALGKAIVTGITSGITGFASTIKDAAVGAVKGALSAVGSFIKHGSPSRLFRDEIGVPISQGIAVGITQASPDIDRALIQAVKPPNLSAVGAVGGAGRGGGGIGVNIENVTVKDVDAMAEAITVEQRDAAVVENLQLALVGAA